MGVVSGLHYRIIVRVRRMMDTRMNTKKQLATPRTPLISAVDSRAGGRGNASPTLSGSLTPPSASSSGWASKRSSCASMSTTT